jgi:hypothetical protein
MAAQVVLNMYLALNGSAAINDHVKSCTLTLQSDSVESTAMGVNWKSFLGGLKSGTLDIEWNDDVASSSVDATLWPLFGTVVTFETRLDAGSVSTSNPKFTGSVLINQHGIGGSVGDLASKKTTYPTTGAIARATA